MSLASSAAKGSAITLLAQAVKILLMLASTVVLARLISPRDYGLVAMVVAVIGVGEIFRDFGLSMAALQAKSLSQAQKSNLFWINTGIGALLTLVVFFLADPLANFYNHPEVAGIMRVLSLTFVLGGISTQFKIQINRDLRFFALSLIDVVPFLIGFVLAVVIAVNTPTYWALVAMQLSLAGGGLLLSVLLARWWPGLPVRTEMRSLLSFGLSFAATQVVSYATRNVDSIGIGRVWGAASLGMYDRAYQLLTLPLNQINAPLSRVAVPVLSRLRDDTARFVLYLRKAQLVALYVTSTIFFLAAGLGEPLVVFVLGERWREAGVIFAILALGGVFRSVGQITYWIYMSKGLAGQQLRYYLVAQPCLAVAILLGLPWGATGVAVAHSLGFAVYWAISLAWVGRVADIDVRPMFGDAIRAIVTFGLPACVASFLAAHLLRDSGEIVQLAAGLGVALICFSLTVVLSKPVRTDLRVLVEFGVLAVRKRNN